MYRIIAADMDGTLLDNKCRIPEINKKALLLAQEKGAHIVIASGRCMVTLREYAEQLELDAANYHILTLNGAAVYDGFGKQLLETRMDEGLTSYILQKILPLDLLIIAYNETDHMFVKLRSDGDTAAIDKYCTVSGAGVTFTDNLERDVPNKLYKIILISENERLVKVEKQMAETAGDMEYGMFFSAPTLLEFTHKNSNKGYGLNFVCNQLNINMAAEAIALGDSFNDMEMIKSAALGVCMKNGHNEVKRAAAYVTERTNDEGGVAEVVEKFYLQG